jgi:phthalate 4,5-dioxygenase oxygenase subunit
MESPLPQKVKHIAYPTREAGGFVWVYMGPPAGIPEFEMPAFAPTADTRVAIVKIQVDCNWAQILEGAIDSAHSSSLHSTDIPPGSGEQTVAAGGVWARPTNDKSPRIQVQRTNYGMRYAAIRRPIANAATNDYVRITTFVAPITVLIPPNNVYSLANVNVPMDDTHTMFYFIAWSNWGAGVDPDEFREFCGARIGIDLDDRYRRIRTRDNNFLQDREAMKDGDHTGIIGIPNQDMAMWETMGPIADRTQERLGTSDLAIVHFRRIMLDAVKRFAGGEPAIGTTEPHIAHAELRSFEGIVPKATNWRALGASDKELAMYPKEGDPKEDIGVAQTEPQATA